MTIRSRSIVAAGLLVSILGITGGIALVAVDTTRARTTNGAAPYIHTLFVAAIIVAVVIGLTLLATSLVITVVCREVNALRAHTDLRFDTLANKQIEQRDRAAAADREENTHEIRYFVPPRPTLRAVPQRAAFYGVAPVLTIEPESRRQRQGPRAISDPVSQELDLNAGTLIASLEDVSKAVELGKKLEAEAENRRRGGNRDAG